MAFFRYGELPLVLLALLDRSPMNGYELLAELESTFGGRYRPSPGSVYPALAALERERLTAAVRATGTRRLCLSPAGRKALADRHLELSAVEVRLGVYLRDPGLVDAELERLNAAARTAKRLVDPAVLVTTLRRARAQIQRLHEEDT